MHHALLGLAGHGWLFGHLGHFWTFCKVWGCLATFEDVLGCLKHKPIYCITIYRQASTCSKDEVIIPRGNGLGLAWLGWASGLTFAQRLMQGKQTIASCLAGLGWALLTFLYDLSGHFWTFLDVLRRFGTFCNILQHYVMFANVLQHFATFCNVWGHFGTFWDVWWRLGHKPGKLTIASCLAGIGWTGWRFWTFLDVSGHSWTFLDISGRFWMFLDILQCLGTCGNVWGCLGKFWDV